MYRADTLHPRALHTITGLNHLAIQYRDPTLLIAEHRLQHITRPPMPAGRLHRLYVAGPHRVGGWCSGGGRADGNQHANG